MSEPVTESALRGVKKAIQDFVAPEIRDLKGEISKLNTRIGGLEKLSDTQFRAIRDQQEAHFRALMAAIGESKATMELNAFKMVSALTERVAVLEATRQ